MEHKIVGTTMPVLEVKLGPGESVIGEAGELTWMSGDIEMRTARAVGAQKGGLFGTAKRALGGGTWFMSEYTGGPQGGLVGFAAKAPGQIREIEVSGGRGYVVHKHGFIAGAATTQLGIFFNQKLGAGVFGGEGFLLQKLEGQGTAFIEMGGEVIEYDLEPGRSIKVHPGHVALFEESVRMGLATVPGIKNKLFGGDGIFLVELTGPGKVWLQSLSLASLANAIAPYLPAADASNAGTASVVGGLVGSLLSS